MPEKQDSDGLDGEYLAGRRAMGFMDGKIKLVGVGVTRMQRIRRRKLIDCGHIEGNGPMGGD